MPALIAGSVSFLVGSLIKNSPEEAGYPPVESGGSPASAPLPNTASSPSLASSEYGKLLFACLY